MRGKCHPVEGFKWHIIYELTLISITTPTEDPLSDLPTTAERNRTRAVAIGSVTIGAGSAIVVQSMCATHTQDVDATVEQANALHQAGAGVVRLAVDSKKDATAVAEIAKRTPKPQPEPISAAFSRL